MKILYIADADSIIAQNWIRYFVARGDQVEMISRQRGLGMSGARVHHVPSVTSFFLSFLPRGARRRGANVSI